MYRLKCKDGKEQHNFRESHGMNGLQIYTCQDCWADVAIGDRDWIEKCFSATAKVYRVYTEFTRKNRSSWYSEEAKFGTLLEFKSRMHLYKWSIVLDKSLALDLLKR